MFQCIVLGLWYKRFKALLVLNVIQKLGITAEAMSKHGITKVKISSSGLSACYVLVHFDATIHSEMLQNCVP